MRRILLLYILFSVIGLSAIHAQLNPARQQIDENGRDQYGNQVDPAMIPDKLDSANVEVQGLPPTLYMWRIKNQLGDRTMIPADTTYHHFQNTNLTEGITGGERQPCPPLYLYTLVLQGQAHRRVPRAPPRAFRYAA